MKRWWLMLCIISGAVLGGLWFFCAPQAQATRVMAEEWVDANHVRVLVRGQWHALELMPLADHLCTGEHPYFRKYCITPKSR